MLRFTANTVPLKKILAEEEDPLYEMFQLIKIMNINDLKTSNSSSTSNLSSKTRGAAAPHTQITWASSLDS